MLDWSTDKGVQPTDKQIERLQVLPFLKFTFSSLRLTVEQIKPTHQKWAATTRLVFMFSTFHFLVTSATHQAMIGTQFPTSVV